ncbi:putative transposase [Borreliella spielmanii]|uniref:Transposase n=1 Tax=Borreliella spielmanii TaxID=88916 RepID=A0ABR6P7P2_9SPIR|nr:transposase [Borreliella spielmanii]MBB6032048.1 putative transposase [Borreliella spielmanii]
MPKKVGKKQKGYINRTKSKLRAFKLHNKISNQRKDFSHRLSYYFISNYKNTIIKNLSVKGMQKGIFGKSINNLGWHEFVRKLSYKLERHGFCFHKVDRYFPSIKL